MMSPRPPMLLFALVDVPLSLAGDIVTMPVVVARRQGCSWATWWGEQAVPESQEKLAESPEAPQHLAALDQINQDRP